MICEGSGKREMRRFNSATGDAYHVPVLGEQELRWMLCKRRENAGARNGRRKRLRNASGRKIQHPRKRDRTRLVVELSPLGIVELWNCGIAESSIAGLALRFLSCHSILPTASIPHSRICIIPQLHNYIIACRHAPSRASCLRRT